jgi:hypothetical protein
MRRMKLKRISYAVLGFHPDAVLALSVKLLVTINPLLDHIQAAFPEIF